MDFQLSFELVAILMSVALVAGFYNTFYSIRAYCVIRPYANLSRIIY